jgi:hypothetical protein
MLYYNILTLMFCVLMKCVVRLPLVFATLVAAYTIIMFDVNYFYFQALYCPTNAHKLY